MFYKLYSHLPILTFCIPYTWNVFLFGLQNIIKKYQGVSVHYCQSQYLKIVKKVKPRSLSWQCNWWYRGHTQKYRTKNALKFTRKSCKICSGNLCAEVDVQNYCVYVKKNVCFSVQLCYQLKVIAVNMLLILEEKKKIFSRAVMLASIEPWIVWICNTLRQENNQL